MRFRLIGMLMGTVGLLSLLGGTAIAGPADAPDGAGRSCGGLRLTGTLPVPAPGAVVQQQVTIGPGCVPRTGPVRYTPAARTGPAAPTVVRQLHTRNEIFDCCGVRLTGLYTTSTWTTDHGRVTSLTTEATQGWHREPWDAGWSLRSSSKSDDCTADCAVANSRATAAFTYRGIFDLTGTWYANTHRSTVRFTADSAPACTFDVEVRHAFIGWNWQRSCE
ncbi:hypothetical protein [Streptomyces orinoci]|uniref:Secreted protein n=1 Tax=Streptomyces orinoci TaxID=67339 RepID=A0ABV3K431_STRON|nr:hypothetical protein [Streptomyces orinoci]